MLCRTSTGALGPPGHSLLHPLSPQDSSTIVGGALGQDRDHVPVVILVPGARRKIIVPPFRLGRLPKFCNLCSNIYFPRPASHWVPIWPTWDFFCYVLGSSWSSWMSLWAALGAISPRLEVLCCLLGACWSLSCPFGLLRAAVGTPIPPNPVPIALLGACWSLSCPFGLLRVAVGTPIPPNPVPIPNQSLRAPSARFARVGRSVRLGRSFIAAVDAPGTALDEEWSGAPCECRNAIQEDSGK